MDKKKIVFIINPISGTHNKQAIPQLIEKLLNHNLYDYEIIPTEYAGHATVIASQAAADGVYMAVAVGGDGTVNEIARALVQTPTILGIIPCGSGNGLARHLMIPLEYHKAIQIINDNTIDRIDYGIINRHPFFCTCGMGFDALVSLKFSQSGHRGFFTYLENILHESLSYKPETYQIQIDHQPEIHTCKAFLIACGNAAQYGNNAYIAPQAAINDGLMDVTVIRPFLALDVPLLSYQLFNKALDQNYRVNTFRCKHLHISRQTPQVIHFDGDPIIESQDLDIEIIPQALYVARGKATGKSSLPENTLQLVTQYFNEIQSDIRGRNQQLKRIYHNLWRKLTKL